MLSLPESVYFDFFYVLSFAELNDCKTLKNGFLVPLLLIKLRTELLAHTRKDRRTYVLMRAPPKRLVIQKSTFKQQSTVTTHLT